MDETTQKAIIQALLLMRDVRERFAGIQENPALHGAENGFTNKELETLKELIDLSGEVNLAGKEISKRFL
jgi:hypothetical protein